jgi:hypothetical protein
MNGASIGGLIVTGTNVNATNTLDYTNYAGNLNLTVTADHNGYTTYGGNNITTFTNATAVKSNGSGTLTIAGPGKTNIIHITGGGSGYINDPLTFTGFNTLINAPSILTSVVFDASALFNQTLNTATVSGVTFNFVNLPNVAGAITSQVSSAQNAAIISAATSAAAAAASATAQLTSSSSSGSAGVSISGLGDDSGGGSSGSGGGGSGGGSSGGSSGGGASSGPKVATNCS